MDLDEDSRHGDAEDEDVGQAQVEQEEVGRVAQVAVVPDDDWNETVADESDDEDEAARERHQEAHVSRKDDQFVAVVSSVYRHGRTAVIGGGTGRHVTGH